MQFKLDQKNPTYRELNWNQARVGFTLIILLLFC